MYIYLDCYIHDPWGLNYATHKLTFPNTRAPKLCVHLSRIMYRHILGAYDMGAMVCMKRAIWQAKKKVVLVAMNGERARSEYMRARA